MTPKIVVEREVEHYMGSGNYAIRAYYDAETNTMYFASSFNIAVYVHEFLHYLIFKLPAGLAHILNLILDLADTFFSLNSYYSGRFWEILKGVWLEYRLDKQDLEETIVKIYYPEEESNG